MPGGAEYRNAVAVSGFRIAGARATADIGRSRRQDPRLRAKMRATGSELDYGVTQGSPHDACRLGGNGRLKPDGRQQIGFDQLRFDQGRSDGQERLTGEERRALAHGKEIAGEPQPGEHIEELGMRVLELRQPGDFASYA